MIRYLLYTMFFGVLALAQSIADVVVVNDENSSNKAFSLVEDRIKKMQSVRILDNAILENVQNPFEYDKASNQDLPVLGASRENSIKVLIGSKIKVGENWLSKGDSIGTTKIVDIKTDGVLLEEKDGNIFTKQVKKEKIDGLEIK
nr:hypothetical protein [uncultured Campylobacter sp.]